jgi:hypothetical protein
MSEDNRREHERIDIEMPTRLWLNEERKGKTVVFEGHAKTRDLAIGGTFIQSDYLLPLNFPINLEMRINDDDVLSARGEVVHHLGEGDSGDLGMGIIFTQVDAENRERLLRFFVSDRVKEFYRDRFVVEFPHLERVMTLEDVALVINLWEDKEGRLRALHIQPPDAARKSHRAREVRATQRRGGQKVI